MHSSDKTEQVAASLFAVHRDLINPKKDSKASAGKFSYAYLSLPALTEYLRPILKEYQLYVTQEITGSVEVTTTVWHLSGQYISFGPTYIAAAGDAQQQGSAMTYCRRYALAAVFNLAADEDDDAQSTSGRRVSQSPSQIDPPPSNVGPEPESQGEGDGGSGPATTTQWSRLLQMAGGSRAKALSRLNKANHSSYTQMTMDGASIDEVAAAIVGGGEVNMLALWTALLLIGVLIGFVVGTWYGTVETRREYEKRMRLARRYRP